MLVLHSRSLAAFVTAGLLVLMPTLSAGQGRGVGRSGSPKPSPPVQAGKPVPPPAAGAARGSAKTPAPIAVKPPLAAKLQPLLPPGMTVEAASAGFKNLGQFVSAVHVSKNLDVPFVSLRTELVDNGRSLGAAIQTLKPGVDAKKEAGRAETQAKVEIESVR